MPLTRAELTRRLFPLLLLALPAGCTLSDDPFARPGTWRAENVNDANLVAMASDKRHLVRGVGDNGSPAVLSVQAIRRLYTDHVKPLPSIEFDPYAMPPAQDRAGPN